MAADPVSAGQIVQLSDIAVSFSPSRGISAARGFTLIELMIVVAIVAILAAIAYPSFEDAVRKSRRGQAKADLVELAQRAERYFTVNNTYAGFEATLGAADLRSPRTGANIYYVINRVDDDSIANSFLFDATPQGGQTRDTRCMTLTLNSVGVKGIDGGSASAEDCW